MEESASRAQVIAAISDGSLTSTTEACTTESSHSSRSDAERPKVRRRRKVRKLAWDPIRPRSTLAELSSEPVLHEADKKHRRFMVFPQFLSEEEIAEVHACCTHASVREIQDRKDNLAYSHKAYRTEMQIRKYLPRLYDKVLHTTAWTDGKLWNKMGTKKLFPELEYIVYDIKELGRAGGIEEHVDNHSAVTLVILLSDPSEFTGGLNYFARARKHDVPRCCPLKRGDCVAFRGERLMHWITPVSAGRRVILQAEFSRV